MADGSSDSAGVHDRQFSIDPSPITKGICPFHGNFVSCQILDLIIVKNIGELSEVYIITSSTPRSRRIWTQQLLSHHRPWFSKSACELTGRSIPLFLVSVRRGTAHLADSLLSPFALFGIWLDILLSFTETVNLVRNALIVLFRFCSIQKVFL